MAIKITSRLRPVVNLRPRACALARRPAAPLASGEVEGVDGFIKISL
jgi:hypothetical protein